MEHWQLYHRSICHKRYQLVYDSCLLSSIEKQALASQAA